MGDIILLAAVAGALIWWSGSKVVQGAKKGEHKIVCSVFHPNKPECKPSVDTPASPSKPAPTR